MEAVAVGLRDPFASAEQRFSDLVRDLRSPERRDMDLSDLEKKLQGDGQELLRSLLQGHLELRSLGQIDGPVVGADGAERTDVHRRSRGIETLFGTVRLDRERFYARGETGRPGLAPLDAELNLPPERASLQVRRRVAKLAARCSFDEVVEELAETTGARLAKRQVEELAALAAQDFDAFYVDRRERAEAAREAAEETNSPSEAKDSLLVLTMDGKGIPMRKESLREATRKAAEKAEPKLQKRRSKGEKAHRKRMAAVAALYSIAPFERTPDQIVDGLKLKPGEVGPKRPKPQNKRVWASVEQPSEAVAHDLFADALARQGLQPRRWVALVDGNETQLGNLLHLAEKHGVNLTTIIDVIHVLEYLWKAGTAFAPEASKELEAWVRERLLQILKGGATAVASGLRRAASRRRLGARARKPVDTCADYLDKYSEYLRYDQYLAAGLPIATGVIEGACRYLVKDRMEKTGARWTTSGAETVLRLRSLLASGDFDEYWAFHERMEHERHHLQHYAEREVPTTPPAKKPSRAKHLRLVK